MADIQVQFKTPEIQKATAETFEAYVYVDGASATPTSPAYWIYDSGLSELATGTPTVASNKMSFSILSTLFEEVEENCQVLWQFTAGAKINQYRFFFDVVNAKIANTIIVQDLLDMYDDLNSHRPAAVSTWAVMIDRAYEEIRQEIKNRGRRPYAMIDGMQIQPLIFEHALQLIFQRLMREPGDRWEGLRLLHEANYQRLLASLNIQYDEDSDLIPDSTFTGKTCLALR